MLSREEIEECMKVAIKICIANGNIDPTRFATTGGKLTEEEQFYLAPEFRWQVAGYIAAKEIKRISEIKDDTNKDGSANVH
jgi:hypothetical protein